MAAASVPEIRDTDSQQQADEGGTFIQAVSEALEDDQCHTPLWTSQSEWATANEACQTPLTTPRLQGVSAAKDYSKLLCTPKVDCTITASHYEYNSDLQLQAIQQILEEQRFELHRVADEFQGRLRALCQAHHAAAPFTQASEQVLSPRSMGTGPGMWAAGEEPGIDLQAIGKASSELARSHSPTSLNGVEDGEKSVAQIFSMDATPTMQVDSRMVRGWDSSDKGKAPSHRSSLSIAGLKRMSRRLTKGFLYRMIHSPAFDAVSCIVIALDAVINGIAADHAARNSGGGKLEFYAWTEVIFLICYGTELLLRACADGYRFFFSGWNIFDFVLVSVDGSSQVYYAMASGKENTMSGVAAARMARMLRLLRAFRVFRLVRFLRELRIMVKCIIACVKTIVWVVLLMFMLIYIFAVYLTGQVSAARFEGDRSESGSHLVAGAPCSPTGESEGILKHRFGTVTDACFSLFMTISGGISWVEVADPLISLHWTNGLVLLIFVFFTVFAMLNIITGVFVDGALKAGHTDEQEIVQDIIEDECSNLDKIKVLFEHANANNDDVITLEEFENQMANPEIRILFKSIGIGVHEVLGLFRLLDLDASGEVTLEEFISGCMRLREGAYHSIDLCTILYENKRIMERWKNFASETNRQFRSLHEHMSSISAHVKLQTNVLQ